MQEQEIELSIGDSIQIGPHLVTLIDVEGPDVSFRIDHEEEFQEISIGGGLETVPR